MSDRHIFLIGPGGVGKSSTGPLLAALLERPFVDLHAVFTREIGNIGEYIPVNGYEAYARANAQLARSVIERQQSGAVIALSSGSLVTNILADVIAATRALVRQSGICVMLVPGADLEQSVRIVVERQLGRGFGLERSSEDRKFRDRVHAYRELADFCVDSAQPPPQVAQEIARRLKVRPQSI